MSQDNKKSLIVIISLAILIVIAIGATFAFFVAQIGNEAAKDVNFIAESVDSLSFSAGEPLTFKLDQDNFAAGQGNKTASTTATATLLAGKNLSPSYDYNVYLDIYQNGFQYTTTDNKVELIMYIKGPDNQPYTASIEGLTYNEDLGGYDITEATGTIKIVTKNITTTNKEIQTWTITITFLNLDSDQSANAGNEFGAKIIIGQGMPAYHNYCDEKYFACKIAKMVDTDSTLYIHDEDLPNGAEDLSYRYSGANYILTNKASAYSNVNDYDSTANGVIKMYCSRGTTYLPNYSYVDNGNCSSLLHTKYYYLAYDINKTGYWNYNDAIEKAFTDGYIQENVSNYVCFGSNDENCSVDNLYRIIGVFDGQVKLIKYESASSTLLGTDGDYSDDVDKSGMPTYKGSLNTINRYHWNYKNDTTINDRHGSNDWETSLLNKINLNTNYIDYLNKIDSKWVNMVTDTKWNIGGYNTTIANAQTFYNAEKTKQTSELSKIGLMYASDYGYATTPSNWDTILNSYSTTTIKNNNWMWMGWSDEWTIMSYFAVLYKYNVFAVFADGALSVDDAYYGGVVRPVFYLKPSVEYRSGDGTITNPYRISLEKE